MSDPISRTSPASPPTNGCGSVQALTDELHLGEIAQRLSAAPSGMRHHAIAREVSNVLNENADRTMDTLGHTTSEDLDAALRCVFGNEAPTIRVAIDGTVTLAFQRELQEQAVANMHEMSSELCQLACDPGLSEFSRALRTYSPEAEAQLRGLEMLGVDADEIRECIAERAGTSDGAARREQAQHINNLIAQGLRDAATRVEQYAHDIAFGEYFFDDRGVQYKVFPGLVTQTAANHGSDSPSDGHDHASALSAIVGRDMAACERYNVAMGVIEFGLAVAAVAVSGGGAAGCLALLARSAVSAGEVRNAWHQAEHVGVAASIGANTRENYEESRLHAQVQTGAAIVESALSVRHALTDPIVHSLGREVVHHVVTHGGLHVAAHGAPVVVRQIRE